MGNIFFKIVAYGVISAFIASCDSKEETEAKYLERGEAYFKEGQYSKAQLEFQNALQLNQKNVGALYKIGQIAEISGNLRLAFRSFSTVEIENPQHLGSLNRLGRFFLSAGDVEQSKKYVEKILTLDSNNAEGLTLSSAVYFRKKDYSNAEADVLSALRLAPGDPVAIGLLASIYRTVSKIDLALQAIEKGLAAHPDKDLLHILKLDILLKSGQHKKAEQAYLSIIELKPKSKTYLISLAKFYLKSKRKEDAERLLRVAVATTPDDDKLKTILADFLANQVSFEAAEKQLNTYLETAPENVTLLSSLATLYGKENFLEKAKQVLKEIRGLDPEGQQGVVASNALARLAFKKEEFDVVRKLVTAILSVAPRNADALIMRARLAIHDEAWSDAVVNLRTVLRDEPSSRIAINMLASAHIKAQDWQLARDVLDRLVKLNPSNEPLLLDLTRVLLKLDEHAIAINLLKNFSDTVPSTDASLKLLAEILTSQGRYDEAEVIVKRIAATEKGAPLAQAALGRIYLRSGRYDDALAAFRTAIRFDPSSERHLTGAVQALIGKKDFDTGLNEIDKFLAKNQDNAVAFYLQGGLYFFKNSANLAISSMGRAIEHRPNWKNPYLSLSQYYLSKRETLGAAISILQDGVKNTNDNEDLEFFLAVAQGRNNDIEGAIRTYENILRRNPKHQVATNNLASLISEHRADDREQLERALSLAERFRTSKQSAFLDTLGWIYFKLGNTKTAIAILEQAVTMPPEISSAKYHLSSAYVKNGEAALARPHLEKILTKFGNTEIKKQARELLEKINKM